MLRFRTLALTCSLLTPSIALAAPGELDCTFGNGGKLIRQLGAPEAAHDAALQSDGRLITLGGIDPWQSSADTLLRLTRIRGDGSLDPSFGAGGTRTHVFPNQPLWRHVAVDSQDRIVAAGLAAPYNAPASEVLVARFLPNGDVDASFGSGGSVGFSFDAASTGAGSDHVGGLVIDAEDRPLVVGTMDANGPVFNPSNAEIGVARLTEGGVLDPAFGSGGIRLVSSPGSSNDDGGRGIAIDSQGRILVSGPTAHPNAFNSGPRNTLVARLDSSGNLDPSFDGSGAGNGVLVLDVSLTLGDDFGIGIAVDAQDRALVLSSVGDDPAITRLLEDGTFDPSFSDDGVVQRSFFGGQDVVEELLVQDDGRLIVTGWPVVDGRFRFSAMRFSETGVLDVGWGSGGVATLQMRTLDRGYSAVLQPDQKLLLAGGLDNDTWFGVARLLNDGHLPPESATSITSVLPSPSVAGEAVTVSYAVTAVGAVPAGTVTVSDGVDSCSASVAAGSCSLVLSTGGERQLQASYSGASCLQASQSASVPTLVQYRVTPSVGAGGSISPAQPVLASPGAQVEFTLTPDLGHRIAQVSGCDGTLDGSVYRTAAVTGHCSVVASFELEQYTLNYSAGPNGSLLGETQQTVVFGGSGTPVTAQGDLGFRFSQWSDGSTQNPRIDAPVSAALDVSASFEAFATATPGTLQTLEDVAASGQLEGVAAAPTTFALVLPPQSGSLVLTDTTAGTFTYTPDPDFHGTDSFSFTIGGAGATSAPETVQIAVTAVNDPPSFTLGTLQAHSPASSGARIVADFAQFDAGPDDEDATQSPEWLIGAIDDPLGILVPESVAVSSDGDLSYTLAGVGGEATVHLSVRDSGGSENGGIDTSPPGSFQIAVEPGADLQVAKSNFLDGVVVGQSVMYTIVVANAGPDPVTGARLVDPLPAHLVDAHWQCNAAESSAACPTPTAGNGDLDVLLDLAVGSHVRFDLWATVSDAGGSVVSNTAQVTLPPEVAALVPLNDASTDSDPILPDAVFQDGFESSGLPLTVPAARALWERAGR